MYSSERYRFLVKSFQCLNQRRDLLRSFVMINIIKTTTAGANYIILRSLLSILSWYDDLELIWILQVIKVGHAF